MNLISHPSNIVRQQWIRSADAVRRHAKLPEQLELAATVEVGQTPSEVVYTENKLKLLHYEARTDDQHDVPILVIYALINRPYILDLQPNRSVVRTLLHEGFDVYLIDWGEPSALDTSLTIGDYVERYCENCVDVVRERSGQDAINILGYCMGGTMSAMYAALHPEKVRNLGLLATGLCFDQTGGVLELWGDEDYYDPSMVTETYGNVPAEFLDIGFAMMDPVENFVTKYVSFYEKLEDDDFVKNFARMERWLGDGIDVAGETYRQFIEDLYQNNLLAKNEMELDGMHVDLERIEMPVLQIVGEYDHLVPPESSVPFNDLVASDDTEVIQFPTGHVGLSVSSRSHEDLWPHVCEWFAMRSGTDEGETTSPDSDEPEASAESEVVELETVSGIGPAYAMRLREAGIEHLRVLAESDPNTVSETAEIPAGFVRGWVAQARKIVDEAAVQEDPADVESRDD